MVEKIIAYLTRSGHRVLSWLEYFGRLDWRGMLPKARRPRGPMATAVSL